VEVEQVLGRVVLLESELADAAPPARALPPQQAIEVTDVVTIGTEAFEFAPPVYGLMRVPRAGTVLARDGARSRNGVGRCGRAHRIPGSTQPFHEEFSHEPVFLDDDDA